MAFTTVGCISATPLFATQSWPAGTMILGPAVLPDRFRYGMILVDLSQLTDLTSKIDVLVQISEDGVNFGPLSGWGLDLPNSGFTLPGGVLTDASGNPVRITGMSLRFPPASNLLRQIQGTIVLSQPAVVGMTIAIW